MRVIAQARLWMMIMMERVRRMTTTMMVNHV